MHARLDAIEPRFAVIETRLSGLEARFGALERAVHIGFDEIAELNRRLERLLTDGAIAALTGRLLSPLSSATGARLAGTAAFHDRHLPPPY